MRALAIAVVALATGCEFSASYDGTAFRCDVSSECPRGWECVNEHCERDPSAIDGGGDGGEADADTRPIIERACPGNGVIIDSDEFDFFAGSRWFTFEDGGGGTIDTVDGVMRGDISVANGRVGMVSAEDWMLEDVAIAFRVPEGAPMDGTYVAFEIMTVAEEPLLTIYRDGDRIVAEQTDPPGAGLILSEDLYAPDEHHVWRIRVQDESVAYEVSPDALDWTELASESSAELPEAFRIRMVLETGDNADDYVQAVDDMVVCGNI